MENNGLDALTEAADIIDRLQQSDISGIRDQSSRKQWRSSVRRGFIPAAAVQTRKHRSAAHCSLEYGKKLLLGQRSSTQTATTHI